MILERGEGRREGEGRRGEKRRGREERGEKKGEAIREEGEERR